MANLQRVVGRSSLVAVAVLLTTHASAAQAATLHAAGFWAGFGDGFLSLLTFLASAVVTVSIYDIHAQNWLYDAGFGMGAISFAAAAGAAAFSAEPEVRASRWE